MKNNSSTKKDDVEMGIYHEQITGTLFSFQGSEGPEAIGPARKSAEKIITKKKRDRKEQVS